MLGTLTYTAPELSRGPHATPASDVFALGVVAYELLTKRPPFDVPAVLEAIAGRALGAPHALPVEVATPIADALRASISATPAQRPTARELRAVIGRRVISH
jgi:serine/threonine-protein kinase